MSCSVDSSWSMIGSGMVAVMSSRVSGRPVSGFSAGASGGPGRSAAMLYQVVGIWDSVSRYLLLSIAEPLASVGVTVSGRAAETARMPDAPVSGPGRTSPVMRRTKLSCLSQVLTQAAEAHSLDPHLPDRALLGGSSAVRVHDRALGPRLSPHREHIGDGQENGRVQQADTEERQDYDCRGDDQDQADLNATSGQQ